MKARKKILFKEQKQVWLRDCLSAFSVYMNRLNENAVLAAVINERESIQLDGHDIKVRADNVQSVLKYLNDGDGKYTIKDPGRLGAWLLNVGFNQKQIESMPVADKLKYDAVVFAAIGTITKNVAAFYIKIFNDHPDMGDDQKQMIRDDWDAFNSLLETCIYKDCKIKVIKLFHECEEYRDYLAEDIIRQLEYQSHDMKFMQASYAKHPDTHELDIAGVRRDVEAAIRALSDDKHIASLKRLLKAITKYEAVDALMQKLNAKGTPYLLRLAEFHQAFSHLRPVLEERRGNKVISASLSFWSPKGQEAAKKMEEIMTGVRSLRKK